MNDINCPIYLINLKENEKGLIRTLRELRKLDVFKNIQIVEAVNKEEAKKDACKYITHEAYDNITNNLKSTNTLPTWGAVGCALSHKNCWEDMISKNFNVAIICEDDIKINDKNKFKYAFYKSLYKTINYSQSILTTFNSIVNTTYYGGLINGSFTGTSCYMINKKCAVNLLKIFPIKEQFDLEIGKKKYDIDVHIYNVTNKISSVTNYEHISSVQYYFIELEFLIECLRIKLPNEIIEKIYYYTPKKCDLILIGNYGYY